MFQFSVFIFFTVSTLLMSGVVCQRGPYDHPTGFCSDRPEPQCCDKREDSCSVPDRGTLCYCDRFCDTARDCCSDVNRTCYNIPDVIVNKYCNWQNSFYKPGERFQTNCNTCECAERDSFMELMCTTYTCIVEDKLVNEINQMQNEWVAGEPEQFRAWNLSFGMDMLLGTYRSRRKVADMLPKYIQVRPRRLPRVFDAREKWPGLITEPLDQGCGASWAFSTVSVASDRWNIMSNGTFRGRLSVQHLLSCNKRNRFGCKGGFLTRGWTWIHDYGLVKEDCYKWTGDNSRCHLPKQKGNRMARCIDGERQRSFTKLHYTSPVYRISSDQYQIMKDIFDNGPVQATMDVFRDFFLYTSGVYSCPSRYKRTKITSAFPSVTAYPGYHSVRLVGWGEDIINGKPVKYWIAANSWGQSWGEGGFFKIRRGENSCHIEEFILAPWIHED